MNQIDGLYYVPNYLTKEELQQITKYLEETNKWFSITGQLNSRRVIHFGYNYSYNRSGIKKIEDIPKEFLELVNPERINKAIGKELLKTNMDQLYPFQLKMDE